MRFSSPTATLKANLIGFYNLSQRGEHMFFVEHIRHAVNLAAQDSNISLCFSGGYTRHGLGPISESQSYFFVAEHYGWWGNPRVREQYLREDSSRDSMENLAQSRIAYIRRYSQHPDKIIVVGYGFKEERFHLHAKTLGIEGGITYHGINNPPIVPVEQEQYTIDLFKMHPNACAGKLHEKRLRRTCW